MTEWNSDVVAQRFIEAARTARRLPPVRVQGYFSVWPAFVRTEYERMAGEDPPRLRFPPSPIEIDQMLEVMRWVQWLEVDQRKLVWMRAKRYCWSEIALCHGCAVRTAQRRWDVALWAVVQKLQGDSVHLVI